jgi:hypothetical protein
MTRHVLVETTGTCGDDLPANGQGSGDSPATATTAANNQIVIECATRGHVKSFDSATVLSDTGLSRGTGTEIAAISINIGLNRVDPNHYNGWSGQLRACENDARDMEAIATSRGYSTILLLNQDATSARVLAELAKAARTLKAGDMLLLTYSGHGGQVPAVNGGEEDDGLDETWVLYDRMLIDNELFSMWSQFAAGVHIFMLSDSCHSGTVSRESAFANFTSKDLMPLLSKFKIDESSIPRIIPSDVARTTYLQHRNMYESLQWSNLKENRSTIGAGVILISGCQDNQTSADGFQNGLFTAILLVIWNKGAFSGNYLTFHRSIVAEMPALQTPKYFKVGVVDSVFEGMTPFTTQTYRENLIKGELAMTDTQTQKTIREILATDGDLRRKVQCAAARAAYDVIKAAGYSITPLDIEEMKADQTAMAIALHDSSTPEPRGDNLPEVIIAAGIGAAIAAGGF